MIQNSDKMLTFNDVFEMTPGARHAWGSAMCVRNYQCLLGIFML